MKRGSPMISLRTLVAPTRHVTRWCLLALCSCLPDPLRELAVVLKDEKGLDKWSTFLIDALVFPGNSGGPVVSGVNLNAIQGTKSQDRAYLIGVVRSYLPFTDVAVSQQTGQARMVSQENSGLAEVVPVDYINEAIVASQAAEAKRARGR
jgi:hypothetical protein